VLLSSSRALYFFVFSLGVMPAYPAVSRYLVPTSTIALPPARVDRTLSPSSPSSTNRTNQVGFSFASDGGGKAARAIPVVSAVMASLEVVALSRVRKSVQAITAR